ncbi:MAG TPA: type II toxin-antitoxin system HicB family antitoxin [Bacteroidales bacterium]|nr:type II toxin-antitoxin system HicB family antitoxin [Bacteroidales bacterium]
MKDVLVYNGFIGTVHFSAEDNVFFGKIAGIGDLITFEGSNIKSLTTSFHEAVEDYIELCKKAGKAPLKSCKGSFNVRLASEIHQKAIQKAALLGISLNQLVQRALENEIRKSA